MNLLRDLDARLNGELYYDTSIKAIYATDASVYKEYPLAVAYPKNTQDIQHLITFAKANQTHLIPRAAGTSLAGQCVGHGIVVDVSKYFTDIIELNEKEQWVRVQPGVIRDELNRFLQPYGLFFGPNTSTANRAMISGMVGNNSCGSTSIEYGSTREHVIELKAILSDGSEVVFSELEEAAFFDKMNLPDREGAIYKQIHQDLSQEEVQNEIRNHFPNKKIHRRNTGYAVDLLLDGQPFTASGPTFNFCKLLAGSEGTLAFTTEIKLHLDPLPLPFEVIIGAHFETVHDSLLATQMVMEHRPSACELMDKVILDCTKGNALHEKNRSFVKGDPGAILIIEVRGHTAEEAQRKADNIIADLEGADCGYYYPIIRPPETHGVWELRKAGLGLLANIAGDAKAVACIEDTAVELSVLPAYIAEFTDMMKRFNQEAVYYAHAGAGEIHLRPILDLKKQADRDDFLAIAETSAKLVKKYNGSLSGEHGDGRVRAPFIPLILGDQNYQLFKRIKKTWDPDNIFNPGKIVDAAPMNTHLRYEVNQKTPEFNTILDFSDTQGLLRMAEKCNGSGDCRKLPAAGGVMCPSYQATRDEKDTTRARANILREFLSKKTHPNPFDHPEIAQILDLCLSCKGCKSDCPSNVDMAAMKAEFLYQYYRKKGPPLRSRTFAHFSHLNNIMAIWPALSNRLIQSSIASGLLKRFLRVAPQRSLPTIHRITWKQWYRQKYASLPLPSTKKGSVYLFMDEFTNFNDTPIGIKAVQLLHHLGYRVMVIDHPESGRAAISKGLLDVAKKYANRNVTLFRSIVSEEVPLIGIEPSAILGFRDEYPKLVDAPLRTMAQGIARHALLIDEFLFAEAEKGHISESDFTDRSKKIYLHGHCHQKALSNQEETAMMLSLPKNYTVEFIPSGCCGMAGSFGYEKEHYAMSMQVGEMVLFPAIRGIQDGAEIAAPGTSCRHQIKDGTGRVSRHPIELLWEAIAF